MQGFLLCGGVLLCGGGIDKLPVWDEFHVF